MARVAPKAASNVWYQARMEAAKYNEKLLSRAGAAEAANMSEDSIKNTELNLEKCMSVEKAVILADLYNSPNLLKGKVTPKRKWIEEIVDMFLRHDKPVFMKDTMKPVWGDDIITELPWDD